jgi:Na+/H+ antiporter NhaD/arsenite permease-like protein
VLLFGLFCVCGNITITSNVDGAPRANALMILVGTLFASWIGTTGASMIMIRPLLRANRWRKHKVQTVVFFIFLVSNIGGALTPVGDPPLLMGYMRGVPFFWSLKIAPIMLLNTVILLAIYMFLDTRAYTKDLAEGRHPDYISETGLVKVTGGHNCIFLVMIVGAVIMTGLLPTMGILTGKFHIMGEVTFGHVTLLEIIIILLAAFLSFKTTNKSVREENEFGWGPIEEVAVLFIGIFITMVPALALLREVGPNLGLTEPYQMFWTTGALSSFLDNTPTYLVFLTTAGTLGATSGIATTVGIISERLLLAISCGAVFMGANTYIGNAPNFMVKAIAESSEVKMPSFFGYMAWSICFLIPVFILDTLIWFL